MDDNVRDVAIALVTVAGGFGTALVVATITVRASRGLERAKWKRELYASFIHATNEIRDAFHLIATGMEPDPGWSDQMDRAQKLFLEIKMIAPIMRNPAEAVWSAVTGLSQGILKVDQAVTTPAGTHVPLDLTRYKELDDAYRVAMMSFVDRASKDLD